MGEIIISKQILLDADWKTIFEKFAGDTDKIAKLLRQCKTKFKINMSQSLDYYLVDIGSCIKKELRYKTNNTVEFL